MNTRIEIKENGTTTLATAGKYCDRNIDVNVEVNDTDAILDGSFSGAYYSDKITSLREGAFAMCQNLTSVSLPNCKTFRGWRTFCSADNLTSINVQNLTTIEYGARTFQSAKLEELNAPNLVSVENTTLMFGSCIKLKKVSFPKLGGATISGSTFNWCSNLKTLILGGDRLNWLESTSAFRKSGIENGTGFIYVPKNLVDTYKTATNWSTFANQIRAIEDYPEITGGITDD